MNVPFYVMGLVSLFVFSFGAQAATASAEMLSYPCAGCHGSNGSSVGPASPSIAGMSAPYFILSMQEFKSGKRPNTIMTRIAKGYTDEEIKLMAGFFAKQKLIRRKQVVDKALVEKGKKLHDSYCERCHENGGRSADDDAGILAGQWAPYLRHTLDDYCNGSRPMPKQMKTKVDKMRKLVGDQGIEYLIHFYADQAK